MKTCHSWSEKWVKMSVRRASAVGVCALSLVIGGQAIYGGCRDGCKDRFILWYSMGPTDYECSEKECRDNFRDDIPDDGGMCNGS